MAYEKKADGTIAMDPLQQAAYANFGSGAEMPEPKAGDCAVEARAGEHVTARQLLQMGKA